MINNETYNVATNQGMTPLLLTIEQVAKLLGLGRTSTYELVMSGQIASVKLGRRRLIPRFNVEKYVDALGQQLR